jgi:hypothetical protein
MNDASGAPPAPEPAGRPRRSPGPALSDLLHEIAGDERRARISVGDLVLALHERAIGALMFIFAFPNALPTPPGTSSILGAPLIFLAAQLAFGLRPWLPRVIAERSMARADFAVLVARVGPWLAHAEKLLRPRLSCLARPPAESLVGAVCLLMAIVLVLPIPLGNMLPALAICLFSLGILERDGVCVLAGLATTVAAIGVVWGVLFAMLKAALYLFVQLLG